MNRDYTNKVGFTIIEMMLAMIFVATLMVAIAVLVIQISNIYTRGITVKEVNQSGRSIASELQATLSQSSLLYIDPGAGDQYDKLKQNRASSYIENDWGGRLCLGSYTYIWNYGKAIKENDPARLNVYDNANNNEFIRFVKIYDPAYNYCTNPSSKIIKVAAVELLSSGENDLVMHYFHLYQPLNPVNDTASDARTGERLYSIEFVLGTNRTDTVSYNSDQTTCKPPNSKEADPSYCSINKFQVVARSGSRIQKIE